MMVNNNLVGGIPIPLTNHGVCHLGYVGIMKFPTEWKKKSCSKPPHFVTLCNARNVM